MLLSDTESFIGSTGHTIRRMWIVSNSGDKMIKKQIKFVPIVYKMYDTILVNAADKKQNDTSMTSLFVTIDPKNNRITVRNDGEGMPQDRVKCGEEMIALPTIIFGHLPASFEYNERTLMYVDSTYGGFGSKVCNVMSEVFTVDTVTKKKRFEQTWKSNMAEKSDPKISKTRLEDYTEISFSPDWSLIGTAEWNDDFVALLKRRAFDVSFVD